MVRYRGSGEIVSKGRTTARVSVDVSSVDPPSAPTALPRLYVVNVILLLAFGLSLSVWLVRYTEYFSVFSAALGFGGLLVWASFLGSILTEARKETIRAAIDRLLQSATGTFVIIVIVAAVTVWVGNHGTLVIESRSDDKERAVRVVRVLPNGGDGESVDGMLAKNGELRLSVMASVGRRYRIEAEALPSIEREVAPFSMQTVTAPRSFNAWRYLIRCDPTISATAASARDLRLEVTLKGPGRKTVRDTRAYFGEAVWVGCAANVPVQREISMAWAEGFGPERPIPEQWNAQVAFFPTTVLTRDDLVTVRVLKKNNKAWGRSEIQEPSPLNIRQVYVTSKAKP